MEIKELIENLKLNIDSSKIYYNELMSKHTTFKVGGPAQCYIKIHNIEDLKTVLKFASQNKIQLTIVGNGSNILVSDKGIKGIVAKIDLQQIEILEEQNKRIINVGAGFKLSMLSQILLRNEISGMEELSGIPGTIGGAVRMNAGAHGKEMKDIIRKVECIDYNGNIKNLNIEELEFGYRTSIFKYEKYIVTNAQLQLEKGNFSEIEGKMKEYAEYRKQKQPIEFPSAGSIFKRGNDFITAKLIDDAGLKGYTIGGAQVSIKHSGFIVNSGNATSKDILKLVKFIKEKVKEKFNKEIELEIEIIGEE